MPDLTITPLARGDLLNIGRYTQERWGVSQRNAYLRLIADHLTDLQSGKTNGRDRGDIRPGLLTLTCRSHLIFFTRNQQGDVIVLRILHQRMDHLRHL